MSDFPTATGGMAGLVVLQMAGELPEGGGGGDGVTDSLELLGDFLHRVNADELALSLIHS